MIILIVAENMLAKTAHPECDKNTQQTRNFLSKMKGVYMN